MPSNRNKIIKEKKRLMEKMKNQKPKRIGPLISTQLRKVTPKKHEYETIEKNKIYKKVDRRRKYSDKLAAKIGLH